MKNTDTDKKMYIPALGGRNILAEARRINPNAKKLDMRKILKEGYPADEKIRDKLPEYYNFFDYPEIIKEKPAIELFYVFPIAVLMAAPTAISSPIDIDEDLLDRKVWNGIRRMPPMPPGDKPYIPS